MCAVCWVTGHAAKQDWAAHLSFPGLYYSELPHTAGRRGCTPSSCETLSLCRRFLPACTTRLLPAQIRLFHTLIRFDPVYVVYFKTNKVRSDRHSLQLHA